MFQKKLSSLFFVLPCIPFCYKRISTKVYVLHFREEENKCLQNSLIMSTILLLKAVFLMFFSNVLKELRTFPIHKVALL